jgi:hypothetical protein
MGMTSSELPSNIEKVFKNSLLAAVSLKVLILLTFVCDEGRSVTTATCEANNKEAGQGAVKFYNVAFRLPLMLPTKADGLRLMISSFRICRSWMEVALRSVQSKSR